MKLGQNWRSIEEYFHTYGAVLWLIIAIVVVLVILRIIFRHRESARSGNPQEDDKD
jgi:hypothetical protein